MDDPSSRAVTDSHITGSMIQVVVAMLGWQEAAMPWL